MRGAHTAWVEIGPDHNAPNPSVPTPGRGRAACRSEAPKSN